MNVIGIDACGKRGWVGVWLVDGAYHRSMVEVRLESLLARSSDADVVAIDMPLGLVESDWRAADTCAKAVLGPRRSSVFMTAPRPVWDELYYPEASDKCLSITGKRISRQTWALAPKLREARECWLRDSERIYEVHPEVSFQAMAGGKPLTFDKRSWRGQALRRSLLSAVGISLPDALGEADPVPTDDVLDAAAAAWSAHRVAIGTAACLPEMAEQDAEGRPVAIWY